MPKAMRGAVEKVRSAGPSEVAVTERGTFFGYGDLVVDMRNFVRLRQATGAPVIFDATHAVQQPGQGEGGASGGQREFIPPLLAAAAAAGADGFFLETHPDPARALSDAATQWPLDQLAELVGQTLDDLGQGPGMNDARCRCRRDGSGCSGWTSMGSSPTTVCSSDRSRASGWSSSGSISRTGSG